MEPSKLVNILTRAQRGDTRDYADLCDRLYWFDGHIRGNYGTRLAQVAASPWQVTPGKSRDPKRQERAADGAAFAQEVLEGLAAFDESIMDLADAIGVGWAVSEIDWDTVDKADVPVDLRWLHPRRFTFGEAWDIRLVDDGESFVTGGVPLTDFDEGKFIVHTPSHRGSYPGVSGVFRSCAWIYLFRRWSMQFWVRGMEKFAWPTIMGVMKRGAGKETRAEMNAFLRDAANDHHLTIEEGQDVKYLETLVKDAGSWGALDEALKAEASKAILGSTDQSEPAKVGAWKAVQSRKGTTVDSRSAVDARQLSRTIQGQLIAPLMRFNTKLFKGVEPATPEFSFNISGTRAPVSQQAVNAGAVTVDELREREGLKPWGGVEGNRVVTSEEQGTDQPDPERPSPEPAPTPAPNKRVSARRRR
jgi:phage gp29-like protein